MKKISGKLFNVKVKIGREKNNGLVKDVREEYACRAVNFTDCEAKITKEIGSADNVKASFDILAEAIAPYKEAYIFDETEECHFYKVKVAEITLDDYDEEKKSFVYFLVSATSIDQARKNTEELYKETSIDYSIAAIIETNILDVFE